MVECSCSLFTLYLNSLASPTASETLPSIAVASFPLQERPKTTGELLHPQSRGDGMLFSSLEQSSCVDAEGEDDEDLDASSTLAESSIITNKPPSPTSVQHSVSFDDSSLTDELLFPKITKLMRNGGGLSFSQVQDSRRNDMWARLSKLECDRAVKADEERKKQRKQVSERFAADQLQQIEANLARKKEAEALDAYYAEIASASRRRAMEEQRRLESAGRQAQRQFYSRVDSDLSHKSRVQAEDLRRSKLLSRDASVRNRELKAEDELKSKRARDRESAYRVQLKGDAEAAKYRLDSAYARPVTVGSSALLAPTVSSLSRARKLSQSFESATNPLHRQLYDESRGAAERGRCRALVGEWESDEASRRALLAAEESRQDRMHGEFMSALEKYDTKERSRAEARAAGKIKYQRELDKQLELIRVVTLKKITESISEEEMRLNAQLIAEVGLK